MKLFTCLNFYYARVRQAYLVRSNQGAVHDTCTDTYLSAGEHPFDLGSITPILSCAVNIIS